MDRARAEKAIEEDRELLRQAGDSWHDLVFAVAIEPRRNAQ